MTITRVTRRRVPILRCATALLALLSWSWVPAQAPSAAPALAGPTRVEQSDPSVVYTGVWYTASRSDLSGGSLAESPYPVSSASLTFVGTGVRWIGFKGVWGGIAQVYMDGVQTATIDTYSPIDQVQAVMYTAIGLVPGPHTITIKVTGTWNPAGCCSWVAIDAFDVL